MKKVYFIIIVFILLVFITITLKDNTNIKEENQRLEKIIELKQEINKEYVYLYEEIENKNMYEEINSEKENIESKNENIVALQSTILELQGEKENIEKELQEKNAELSRKLEEKKKLEIERQKRLELERQQRIEESTVKIEQEITYSQFPEYPTGCESVALYILLKYYNVDVTVEEIVSKLKKGSLPYKIEDELYGGNPEIEFIGDPKNDFSYGVFNTPIAEVAKTFKENVFNKEGLELEEILDIVKENRPVMVWTTINNAKSNISKSWIYRQTGERIYWKDKEHAVVIIGYNDEQVIVSDPYTGKITRYNRNKFKQNYNYLGKRAVYY